MFLGITEKEMTVFGVILPKRCVLLKSQSDSQDIIICCTQNEKNGEFHQWPIVLTRLQTTRDAFEDEVRRQNGFYDFQTDNFVS